MAGQHKIRPAGTRSPREAASDARPGVGGGRSANEPAAIPLTVRELTVLSLIAQGLSDKEIAVRLGISGSTVHKHVGSVLKKLDVNSRTEAAVRAVREEIV